MRIDSSGRVGFGGEFDLTATDRVSINPNDGLIGFGMNGRDSYITGISTISIQVLAQLEQHWLVNLFFRRVQT